MEFSICMCVYKNDNAKYFAEALESTINQKLLPNEIVLVIDGYIPKNTQKVIENFRKKLLQLGIEFQEVCLPINKGHGEARKISVEQANYDLIALADADDINDYNRFYKEIQAFKNDQDLSIVGSQIIEIDDKTKKEIGKREVPLEDEDIKNYMKLRCPFNQMSVMFRKKDVLAVGNYIDFYHNEDYYLWIRMKLVNYKFKNLSDYLVFARVNSNFYNRRGGVSYFLSEYKIQKIMFQNNIINLPLFVFNVSIRFILQVILTDKLRGFIFKSLFRKGV